VEELTNQRQEEIESHDMEGMRIKLQSSLAGAVKEEAGPQLVLTLCLQRLSRAPSTRRSLRPWRP